MYGQPYGGGFNQPVMQPGMVQQQTTTSYNQPMQPYGGYMQPGMLQQQQTTTAYGATPYPQPVMQPGMVQQQMTTSYNQPVMQPGMVQQTTTAYGGSPYPQPMQPGMVQQTTTAYGGGGPIMQPGVVQQQTTTIQVPTAYNRTFYQYPGSYNRSVTFGMPSGLDAYTQSRFTEASTVFRHFDRSCCGSLSWYEWKEAMHSLGHYMSQYEAETLFRLVDKDGSGRIDEREFCEFWAFACNQNTGYFRHHHRGRVDVYIPTPHIHLPKIPSVHVHLGHHHHHHRKW